MRQLLISYAESLPVALEDMDNAFSWHNYEQIKKYAHKLKSSTKSMGALKLAISCHHLELAGLENRWSDIESAMPRFRREAQQVLCWIHSFLATPAVNTANVVSMTRPQPVFKSTSLIGEFDDDVTDIKLRVLIIDDDYIMHRVTTLILNDLGIYNVKTSLSGPKALEILEQHKAAIDLIICDLNMPEMDGIEFMRHLAKKRFAGPIILSSGEDLRILKTVEKLANEHQLNVLGIMEKPATPLKISELLDSMDAISSEGTMLLNDAFTLDELTKAVTSEQMDTYFQPKVDIASGRVVGLEALVRWNHPTIGLVMPNAFIPMAEEYGLISKLTITVCERVLGKTMQLIEQGFDLNIAINISADTLSDLAWPDEMAAKIQDVGLHPSRITFEITESKLMDHISIALDILSRLSLKRFNLSIDDFGTGYSSMEQLQRVPFKELKIDRAFVKDAVLDNSARAILESSVLLAKKLDMKVVAEGVETRADWDLLVELNCDQAQGFFISKPLPFEQLLSWIPGWNMERIIDSH
jgi:EAL domain-containing protein (putative c-di-GMP-specific phosphodiesterase class I)/HPt (histidine-containing phosphotransfer) domain-containing protein